MRNRTKTIGLLVIGLLALPHVVGCVIQHGSANEGGSRLASEPVRDSGGLLAEDEVALQSIIAKHFIATASWAPGGADPCDPSKSFRVLVLPEGVGEIFRRKPIGTLWALKQTIKSGTADDAHTAIAYAYAAVGYANDDPVPLICAHTYAFYPTAKEFDEMNSATSKTYRQRAVDQIDKLIAEAENARELKQAVPKKE